MPPGEYHIDYVGFMEWFAANYPDLFRKYGNLIVEATDGHGLKVQSDNIDDKTNRLLYEIQNEYYSIEDK